MPTWCAVPKCKTHGGFNLPKDKELRQKWLVAIKRKGKNGSVWEPPEGSDVRICHDHFKPSEMTKVTAPDGKRVRTVLKKGAIPTVFPWNQSELKTSERSKRMEKRNQGNIMKYIEISKVKNC